MGCTDKANIL